MTPAGHLAFLVISVLVQVPKVLGSQDSPQCNATLTSPTGAIQSPNYPNPYPGGVTCLWHINFRNVTNVSGITLLFKKYTTQTTNAVTLFEEELLIYERNPFSVNATPHVYRGPSRVYQSNENELWLKFSSAQNITDSSSLGFNILYSAVMRGELCQVPNRPQNVVRVGNNTHVGSYLEHYCNTGYRLVGTSVVLCVLQAGVPTWSDTTPSCVDTCTVPTINNGNAAYPNLHINSSATVTCTPPYIIQGNDIVSCIRNHDGAPTWNKDFPHCVIPNCSRVVELHGDRGAIVNPGYATHSGGVQSGKSCLWHITVKTGFVVHVSFRYFDLPSDGHSSLEVADIGEARNSLLTLAGGETARNVTSASNKVEILYNGPLTNSSSHSGFYIQYQMGSAGGLGQGHGTLTPFIPVVTTPTPTSTQTAVTTYEDDGSGTIKIAVGVAVPLVILLGVSLGLYLWYRKKYPVRMIIGREFAKFSNPDYNVKANSTLTLVREDADEFFNTASRVNSHVNLVIDQEGPHYVNVAFKKDENGELSPEEHQPIDPDEEDRELMKRKSYLFTPLSDSDSEKKKAEESSSDSDSASEAGSHSGGSQASRKTHDVVVAVEHDQDVVVDIESSANQSQPSQSDIDSFNSHFPNNTLRHTSVDVLLERSKDRRAFTNEERPVRRFSFDASLSVRGRSLSAKTPAEVSKEAEKLNALLSRCNFNKFTNSSLIKEEDATSLEATDDKSDKHKDDVDGGENHGGETDVVNEHENTVTDTHVVYENATITADSIIIHDENIDSDEIDNHQNEVSPEVDLSSEEEQDEDSATTPKAPQSHENVPDGEDDLVLEEPSEDDEESPEADTCKDTKEEMEGQQLNVNDRDVASTAHAETADEISTPDNLKEEEKSDDDEEQNLASDLKDGSSVAGTKYEKGDPTFSDEIDGSLVAKVISESEESDQEDNIKVTALTATPGDTSEMQIDRGSNLREYENGDSNSEKAIHNENAVTLQRADPNENDREDLKPRPKSDSINRDDVSAQDSVSVASTSSHVSGSYNFGRTPPESEEEEEEGAGEEDEGEMDEVDSAGGVTDVVDQINEQSEMKPTTTSERADEEDSANHDSDVSSSENKSENKPGVNLDTSSISSLDQSVLDTSVELSTTSADSPMMQKRLPEYSTSNNPPKKVAAPVFNIADDDDDDPLSDASSSESEDEDRQRKRDSKSSVSVMPGIEEESDSDEGHSRSYNFGHTGDDDSDSDAEGGRKFTDDDLLAELSDDSSSDEKDKGRKKSASLTPGVFVFDENIEDDLDV